MKNRTVQCHVPNGLILRVFEMKEGPLGIKQSVPYQNPVTLKPGQNTVDEEFIQLWLKQNPDQRKLVTLEDED